ncbi:MAG: prolipoprotein diacylglyceryl transferase [Rhodospirillales bacterium]|nr:prolipoprotein diacylglyceryl transferase [Rhodospirillales bacterium]
MTLALAFPAIDPVAFEIGPVAIRWYALAYMMGLVIGWQYVRYLAGKRIDGLSRRHADNLVVWCTLGVVVGGRLGYVLFYQPSYYLANPGEIPVVWHGGMSFHGGLLGVLVVAVLYARVMKINLLSIGDAICMAAPVGLFFGRMANFINGELYGRASDVSWAMVFPHGGPQPRHPSQLYEAILEGIVLFAILTVAAHVGRLAQRPGTLAGIFFAGYGVARIISEFFREPDAFLGFILPGLTMGQALSLPMLLLGFFVTAQVV